MKLNKFLIGAIIVVVVAGIYFYFMNKKSNDSQNQNQDQYSNQNNSPTPTPTPTPEPAITPPAVTPVPAAGSVATIETSMGSFQVTLDAKAAPKTVANFVKLAKDNYCNNTKFHRILKDFVIQGCDPNSIKGDASTWGSGGPGYTVPAEIGLKANIGAIGMASTQAKGPSSGSQFFIVTTENANNHASLDGNYTFFGYVTSGMDVVTKIAAVPVQPNLYGEPSLPNTPVIINKITIK